MFKKIVFSKRLIVWFVSWTFLSIIISTFLSSAIIWKYGSTHVHTGYSTLGGYDGNLLTTGDNCAAEWLGVNTGYSVDELKQQALNLNLNWLAFSDHSYCLSQPEFNTVRTDCQNAQDSNFTCLWGEELSVEEDGADFPDESFCSGDSAGHLGAYGASSFIESEGNEWCPEWPNSQESITNITNLGGISIVNHPHATHWDWESFGINGGSHVTSGETGIEIWNAGWDSGGAQHDTNDELAKSLWINELHSGEIVYAYGGTDTHSSASTINYNLVGINSLTYSSLESGLSAGTNVVSNNGYVIIEAKKNSQSTWTQMGGEISANTNDILNFRISYNVPHSCDLRVYKSTIGSYVSLTHYNQSNVSGLGTINLPNLALANPTEMYFRAECIGSGGTYRTYTNPIWLDVLSPSCQCTNWVSGSCGGGSCSAGQRQETRTCTPSACSAETRCVTDSSCNAGGGNSTCTEPGYEQCSRYVSGNCDVSIAVNYYGAVNNISWGTIGSSSAPYVIDHYTMGWKKVDARYMYYDIDNIYSQCVYGGCSGGQQLSGTSGTIVTVNAPGVAHTESLVGYDDTSSTSCVTSFNDFNPNYGSSQIPLYVLNCYSNSDCSASQYCNKAGSWNTWSCVNKLSNGQACTSSSQCQSNYCDNDGVGLADDGWCFSPYNTYFDSQETNYCEYSTTSGITGCDERQVGEDLNLCVGLSYREEECSSVCGYQDVTSIFECGETGCSCAQPLCDGLSSSSNITTCASGTTYFADKCSSSASGEDRGDNVCRSSSFDAGCSAPSQCNGVVAGTGNCTQTCQYSPTNDINKFLIQNSSGYTVAWLGDWGNIALKGTCSVSSNCVAPSGSLILGNATDNSTAYFDPSGNLCLESGSCSDGAISCNPTTDAFIIQNFTGVNMSYVGSNGNLCLMGGLYQNAPI